MLDRHLHPRIKPLLHQCVRVLDKPGITPDGLTLVGFAIGVLALPFLALGWYLGFDGPVTYKNARKTVEVAEMVPLNRILIETDSPYMSPVPLRGKRNDSRNVFYIAEKLAQIKGMTTEELARLTMENGKSLFGIQ